MVEQASWRDPNSGFQAMPMPRLTPRGHAVAAWVVIVLAVAFMVVMRALEIRLSATSRDAKGDQLANVLMELQAKIALGAAKDGDTAAIYPRLTLALNKGAISQRQRFVILAGELVGPDEASQKLRELDELIEKEQDRLGPQKPLMSAEQQSVQRALHDLYDEPGEDRHVDRDLLLRQLGWFGRLALAPPDTDNVAARQEVLKPARQVYALFMGGFIALAIGGIAGFACLVTLLVLAMTGRVKSRLRTSPIHHGIYAETFAVWIALFLLLQVGAGSMSRVLPALALVLGLVAFFGSLLALYWPVMRGVSWADVRLDIGWFGGLKTALEPIVGIGGYFMALPILAAGAMITIVLVLIQNALTPERGLLEPTTGPAHPVIQQLTGEAWWPKIMVLILAAVAAPIVEETMFRGVLYRHLRDATGRMGIVMSILVSGLVSAFIFAIIHPQGWVAVPVLMSLALAFVLMREWRGTIVPCMIMHGMSNFIVISSLIFALR
jgi:membrane protease YdiL (CAAX protease family)